MTSSSSSSSDGKQIKRNFSAYNSIFSTGLTILKTIVDEEEISSRPRKTRNVINRQREETHLRLMKDYVEDDCVFDEGAFRRRFRMSKGLFLRIVDDLENANVYFTQRWDARGRMGFTPLQKCTSAIWQLAYGTAPDGFDEYLHMSERSSRETTRAPRNAIHDSSRTTLSRNAS